jgi:hypothetical protein
MAKPRRIQLSRKRGWRKPANTVVVSRPSKWGNPWPSKGVSWFSQKQLVKVHREWLVEQVQDSGGSPPTFEEVRRELRGKNLACWCPLDQPCHADVLLEIAN